MAGNWWDDEEVQLAKPEYKEGAGKFAPKISDKNWWEDEEKPKILTAEESKKLEKQLGAKSKFDKYNFMKGYGDQTVFPSLTKGIPILGNAVPQTEELSQFEDAHPWASKSLQAAGAVGSTLPAAGAAAVRSGAGFIPQLAGQTAVSGPLNLGDTYVKAKKEGREPTTKDAAKALAMATASSVLPAATTSMIGQASRTNYPWDSLKDYIKSLKGYTSKGPSQPPVGAPPPWALNRSGGPQTGPNVFPGGAPRPPDPAWVTGAGTAIPGTSIPGTGHNMTTALSGIGGALAEGGPMGALSGLVAGRLAIHPMIEALSHTSPGRALNTLAHHPSTQDILRALSSHAGRQMTPNLGVF